MVASKKSSHRRGQTTPRHAWLAALGLFVVARREAIMACEIAFDEAARLRKQLGGLGDDARAVARGGVMSAREQVEPIIAEFGAGLEARFAPMLGPLMERFGLPPLAGKRTAGSAKTRKTSRTASSRRTTSGAAAKRAPRRAKG